MSKKETELNDIFDLKPRLTFGMELAASFALTYYALMFLYYVLAAVFYRYSIDFYYLGRQSVYQNKYIDILVLSAGLLLSTILVLSLILILCKKTYWKAVFVIASLILIVYQLFTTSFHPWMKYAIEVLMVLVITPIRIKKIRKIRIENNDTNNDTDHNNDTDNDQNSDHDTGIELKDESENTTEETKETETDDKQISEDEKS